MDDQVLPAVSPASRILSVTLAVAAIALGGLAWRWGLLWPFGLASTGLLLLAIALLPALRAHPARMRALSGAALACILTYAWGMWTVHH